MNASRFGSKEWGRVGSPGFAWWLALFLAALFLLLATRIAAAAEEATAKNDTAAKKDGPSKDAKPADAKDGANPDGIALGEVLSFRQAKVAAEMTELEERMYRLSEALKSMEPENSSRLMLGLKFAREELILHQMKEAQAMLSKRSLGEAAVEEKQLLSKLERLHDLLLATDLDFQMQMEKLRQIREVLRRLDKAIKEEDRERADSKTTAEKQKELEGLRKKRASLEELIARQQGHIEATNKLAGAGTPAGADKPADADKPTDGAADAPAELAKEQAKTQAGAKALAAAAAQAGQDAKNLVTAEDKMAAAAESLEKRQAEEALPAEKEALAALEKERDDTAEAERRLEEEVKQANFAAMQRDQAQNRQLSEGITQMVRDLGESGAGALGEMMRAGTSMSKAEGQLASQQAEPASEDQQQALESLKYARQQLEDEAEKLLDQLRAEVKRRVMDGLTLMLEKQVAVRESTELVGPKAATGSRQAMTAVVGLGKSEGRLVEMANELITLVEETEFGIALPAALLMVRDAMGSVQASLAEGDGSEKVVNAERQIESDLAALLDAMKQLPSSKMSDRKGQRGGQRDRQRELNRLIAELKMIRLLQVRTNQRTTDVDQSRAGLAALSAAVKDQIEAVADQQDFVREATERLAEERGEELDRELQ
ncbi:MAG TPA: hypothetical protein VG125_33465 [Pirellulales bacterium]|jgi:hypothetical protein|nr:hypothetical protein [Pirellulales bacterium]